MASTRTSPAATVTASGTPTVSRPLPPTSRCGTAAHSSSRSSPEHPEPSQATYSRPTTSSRALPRFAHTSSRRTPVRSHWRAAPRSCPRTFAEVDADAALTPDLVVVPALSKPTGETESPLRRWVTKEHDHGAKVLGVCAGSLVLADTGMLDGLHAPSHWSRINALQQSRPAVHWVTGRR